MHRPTPRPRRAPALVLAALTAGLLAAACGGSKSPAADPASTTQPAGSTTASVAGTTTGTGATVTSASAGAGGATSTLAQAAPAAGSASTGSDHTSCKGVVHIGDSTSVGLTSPAYLKDPGQRIDAQYARVGVSPSHIHLEISGARSILETLPNQINAYDTARNLKAAGFSGCWVFALGTTDTANVAVGSRTTREARIDRMMSVVGNDPVLWVDVKSLVASGAWSNANMQLWNQALTAAQARYPNLKIYDWASVVQNDWFSSDKIHYTSAGYAQRAHLIADALATAYPG